MLRRRHLGPAHGRRRVHPDRLLGGALGIVEQFEDASEGVVAVHTKFGGQREVVHPREHRIEIL